MHHRLRGELDERYAELGALLDAGANLQENRSNAAGAVRKQMFLEKLLQEIDDAIADAEERM